MTASLVTASEDDALAEQIKPRWDMKSNAYRCDLSGRSKEGGKALQMLEQTTKIDGEGNEVGSIWKRKDTLLPKKLLSCIEPKEIVGLWTRKKVELNKLYQNFIKVDVENGFVRILKQEALEATKLEIQWYVPQHAVKNPSKPEKNKESMQRRL